MTTLNHPRGRHLGRCDECGKCCYPTRAAAKAAMKADGNVHSRLGTCLVSNSRPFRRQRRRRIAAHQVATAAAAGRLNYYTCDVCHGHTVTIDVHEGTTPMFLACRAPGKKCLGRATSAMYPPQPWPVGAPRPKPAWDWYRPSGAEAEAMHAEVWDHVRRGGLLLRKRKAT